MKITNKRGLPEAIRKACESHEHRRADYSVTELLKDAQEIAYLKMLDPILEDDCADRMWSIFGTAVHKVLEEQETEGVKNEVYLTTEVLGKVVSGIADVIDTLKKKIVDYKTASVWKFKIKPCDFSDWCNQLRAYLYLYYVVTGEMYFDAEIIAILRDWSQTEADRDCEYPQSPVQVVKFHFTKEEILKVKDEWEAKIGDVEMLIRQAMNGQQIGFCSDDSTWTTETTYAVMKVGRKTALRVFKTKEEAEELAQTEKGAYVEERKGEHKKCSRYCLVARNGFCRGAKV